MTRYSTRLYVSAAAALLLAGVFALVSGCGGGRTAGSPATTVPGAATSMLTLTLRTASTDAPAAGASLRVELACAGADSLHQLACRVGYDPLALRPVGAYRGSLVDSRAVFFSAGSSASALTGAYVPLAFTYHPGETIPAAGGTIAILTFEVLDPSRATGLTILRNAGLPLARDSRRGQLPVEVAP